MTQSMAGQGHQFSIVGGKIVKEEVTRTSETQSTKHNEDEKRYQSEYSLGLLKKSVVASVEGDEQSVDFVDVDDNKNPRLD